MYGHTYLNRITSIYVITTQIHYEDSHNKYQQAMICKYSFGFLYLHLGCTAILFYIIDSKTRNSSVYTKQVHTNPQKWIVYTYCTLTYKHQSMYMNPIEYPAWRYCCTNVYTYQLHTLYVYIKPRCIHYISVHNTRVYNYTNVHTQQVYTLHVCTQNLYMTHIHNTQMCTGCMYTNHRCIHCTLVHKTKVYALHAIVHKP